MVSTQASNLKLLLGEDTVRLGVIRPSMLADPLLHKPALGRAKPPMSASTQDRVHGVASGSHEGGVQELMNSWHVQSASSTAHLPLHKSAPAGVLEIVHGQKSLRSDTVAEVFATTSADWPARSNHPNPMLRRPSVGKGIQLDTQRNTMVHGLKTIKGETTAEIMSDWRPATVKRQSTLSKIPSTMAFGIRSRREDSVADLISNKYQTEWLSQEVQRN